VRKECRLCGSGGQGIILAGIILAEAAGIYEDKFVTQVQDYGPAARGDSSKTDVVISDEEIYYPKCMELDLLVALSQRAYEKNRAYLKEDGLLIVDLNNVKLRTGEKARKIPMTDIARNEVGSPLSVNMVALGAIAALDGIAKFDSIKNAMLERVPSATKEQNLAALERGYQAAKKNKKAGVQTKSKK
jgi:2-oxoglutarate ferredoxin oxidoreductase subunit gamma